ncbi:hypothetical protein [Streptomyces sp. NPDC005385]|uniref:hypothetical protein n=1 Tax=Streptomyces sp. NPDC005385 TaxID=3157039 RepID=UPI0033ACCD3C
MPTRKYTKSPAAQAAMSQNAAKARAARLSVDNYVRKVVENAGELKPHHIEKLRALLPPVSSTSKGGRAA